MSIKIKFQGLGLPEDTWLEAKLTEIAGADGSLVFNGTPCFKFVFTLAAPEYDGRQVSVLASQRMTPNSKLTGLVTGMLGRILDENEEVDLEKLIGVNFQILLDSVKKDEKTYYNVSTIRPIESDGEVME